jgi:ATP/maltotriose-dependent transcriptional regulator MalT
LVERCRAAQVVVVEAAGGYGKTVFAAELVDAWRLLPVWALLEEGVTARLLAARLRAAVARAGLSDTAAEMTAAGDDPVGAVDVMLDRLAGESCVLVIDDAHNADRDAARLLDRLVAQPLGHMRVLILARRLPPGLTRLRRAETLTLDAADLRLLEDETLSLCRSGFGLNVSIAQARALHERTGGWTAAAVLAASRASATAAPLDDLAPVAGASGDALSVILDEVVRGLELEPRLLATIAALPVLDPDLLAQLGGGSELFERLLASGLPLARGRDGRWELPGPVRDHLAQLGAPEPELLQRAAGHYEQRGRLAAALRLLLAAGDFDAAARLLAGADSRRLDAVEPLELLSAFDRLPRSALIAAPRAVLNVSRACYSANLLRERARLLDQLVELLPDGDPALRRALDAERAADLSLGGEHPDEAEALARTALDGAGAGEELTRARALTVIGKARWWICDPDGRRSVDGMREAASYFDQAAEILLAAGERAAVAALSVYRAIWIEFELGRPQEALRILDEGLALSVDIPRRYSSVLFYRAKVFGELGRFADAEADLDEVLRIARSLPDPANKIAYDHWERFKLAAMRGDAAATVEHVRLTETHRADWWAHARADFQAEAADCLARVGEAALGWEYFERVREDPGDAERLVAMAECSLLARHGDPELAGRRLSEIHLHGIVPREFWRVELLRAYAAYRRGDAGAGAIAARAFEEAARIGQSQLPLIAERELTESLIGLAVATGLPAAVSLEASALPVSLSLLGDFGLTRGGRPVELAAGQGRQLLKLVAVSGGRIPAERAIETLWPESDPEAGRNRLRTVLGRLREEAPDVVIRDGELLALGPEVATDLGQFLEEARRARALGDDGQGVAVALARSAISRYRGPLLAHDPYDSWLEEPRERARRTMLDLLDLCSAAALERGDLDEARRLVERTIELAPYDDDRYLEVALILQRQGRTGAALSVLRRARAALAQLGIDPPPPLERLEQRIAAGDRAPASAPRA